MPDTTASILVVDDEDAIRTTLSLVFQEIGYSVRSAENGFSALFEIGQLIPDILLSDLHMPSMSGFELLSVVRRRFPAIWTIAMSGAFSGSEVPSGVAADAFYEKGSDLRALLQLIGRLPRTERKSPPYPAASAPLWIQRNGSDAESRPYVSIKCPECQRTFHQFVGGALSLIR